ncbi:PAS domain S-box protein [uncultured Ramlibacter sp.]|uniref:PAS domain-containing sensor histidine kinase n=1 Tax=uncultured Ramlibacter sp. TaxID=260755 RepID=UPI002614DF4B|nr:PAS domain S-box protein [uncultured Ramlibacter sp.]
MGEDSTGPSSQQQYSAAFDQAAVGMVLMDRNSHPLRVNRAAAVMLGYLPEELIGPVPPLVSDPENRAKDIALRAEMLAGTRNAYQREKALVHRDGHTVWTLQTCTLARDGDGKPVQFILQVQDITESKAREDALRVSEEHFRANFEQAPLGIAHLSKDGRTLRANQRMCDMLGYTREEIYLQDAHGVVGEEGQRSREQLQSLLRGEAQSYTAERFFTRKDGTRIPARVSVSLVRNADEEPYFISVSEDISQQLADQRRIREQAQMLDQASDAIVLHSLDRRIRYWNQGAERLFGFSAAQALDQFFAELTQMSEAFTGAHHEELLATGHLVTSTRCRSAAGKLLDIDRRLTLIRDEQGQPSAVLSVNTDVTQRRAAEREVLLLNSVLERRVRLRTEKLEESNAELRTFAYSLAHDLRAPLGSIDGFSRQLERRLEGQLDTQGLHYMERVRAGVKLMSDLTDALLSLANLSQAEVLCQSVDLSALARAWEHRMRGEHPEREISVSIADTPRVVGDVRLLADLLEQLLDNAWKFTSRREGACIELGVEEAGGAVPVFFVRDNGVGFDSAYASKLFVPFQRLHSMHEFDGTGIGLAIVRKIALLHGGQVWGESGPGGGAVFRFTLNESEAG